MFGGGGLGSIFDQMFGGRNPFARASRPVHPRETKPKEPIINFRIPFADLKKGKLSKKIRFKRQEACNQCNGKGGENPNRCEKCSGLGKVYHNTRQGNAVFQSVSDCDVCHGRGQAFLKVCNECKGIGAVTLVEMYELDINCKKIQE